MVRFSVFLLLVIMSPMVSFAQSPSAEYRVLIVTAHPDDEALFAGSVYRLSNELDARVDLAVVTDGAGGFRYSILAEKIYGLNLTDPAVAKEYLPGIRKKELIAGGKFIGLRNYYFFDQPDTGYTLNPDSILSDVWDAGAVETWLVSLINRNQYDFVFVHLPRAETHGHHKSASILALEAARRADIPPVVLGAWISSKSDSTTSTFSSLDGYPITQVQTPAAAYHFDRTTPFGHDDRLNYQIVANWLIAEHKTQGTMQLFMGYGDVEDFWIFESNPEDAVSRTESLFKKINDRVDNHLNK